MAVPLEMRFDKSEKEVLKEVDELRSGLEDLVYDRAQQYRAAS